MAGEGEFDPWKDWRRLAGTKAVAAAIDPR